jgi:RNA polymerase sigma-70 factor, ECF subfamily
MAHNARRPDPPARRTCHLIDPARRPRSHSTRLLQRMTQADPSGSDENGFPNVEDSLRDQMLALLPNLRAFALSLTNDPTRADDLVQDTILRAWARIDQFERGTNLGAWLFTILRNRFYTEHRKRKREVEDPNGVYGERLIVMPSQEAGLEMAEFRMALARLSVRQREALLLIGAEGLSYDEAALIQCVSVGTVKSRVHRARSQLADLLQIGDWHEIGPDRMMKAALQGSAAMAS